MVGGGIFSILGISVSEIGNATPIAIGIGGLLAFLAAYSYTKLALLYKDEGATYSFFKRTFPRSYYACSAIGWLIVFGYVSTLGLYAYTFAAYLSSVLPFESSEWITKSIAGAVILVFALLNIRSVRGMGRVEDFLVYTKLLLLLVISGLLTFHGSMENFTPLIEEHSSVGSILIVASLTFVAYEGFQLVIHAYNEMQQPSRNIPRAIYGSIGIATALYIILAIGALMAIPKDLIIQDQEYALAAGAENIIGKAGLFVVIFGALLATSSAVSATLFGASRLIAVIATDGYFPKFLSHKIKETIPRNSIVTMTLVSFLLILSGGLESLIEFGSLTFILVSFLMAYTNFKKRTETKAHILPAILAMAGLFVALISIVYYQSTGDSFRLIFVLGVFALISIGAVIYARRNAERSSGIDLH